MNQTDNLLYKHEKLFYLYIFLLGFQLLQDALAQTTTTEDPVTKIVGGIETKIEEVPWLAQIRFREKELCGAALLNQEWILSSAHCFPGWRSALYNVQLGRQNKYGDESRVIVRNMSKIITHPDYGKAKRFDSDVALIKLNQKVDFNNRIRAIPTQTNAKLSQKNLYCCTAGWGETLGQGREGALNQVCITTYDTKICNNSKYYDGELTENMFCGGYDEGGSDSCQGDSGGPIVCYRNSVWILEGVTSFGQGCGTKPGVYAKISQFSDWISATIAKN